MQALLQEFHWTWQLLLGLGGTIQMNIFRFFLGGRRWALFLPFLVAYVLVRSSSYPMSFGVVTETSLFLGVPYWLGYWLSDGFRNVEVRPFNTW